VVIPEGSAFPSKHFMKTCRRQQARWPDSMLASSTHDTKRSEDVRARLAAISEIPEAWCEAVRRWAAMNERHRHNGLPDRNIEYFYYQTLAGAWPLSGERALACMEKASCEAGQHTKLGPAKTRPTTKPCSSLSPPPWRTRIFREDLDNFVATLAEAGRITSLAQTLLKLTAPGVPDFYQGCELWDLSLMDPGQPPAG